MQRRLETALSGRQNDPAEDLFRFQIKDDIKAARTEATKAYSQYVEEPKTSQQRCRFDLELELQQSEAL
jgi:hypothetical protein